MQKAIALSLQHDAGSGKNNTEISADLEKLVSKPECEVLHVADAVCLTVVFTFTVLAKLVFKHLARFGTG